MTDSFFTDRIFSAPDDPEAARQLIAEFGESAALDPYGSIVPALTEDQQPDDPNEVAPPIRIRDCGCGQKRNAEGGTGGK